MKVGRRELLVTWGIFLFSIVVLVIMPFQANFHATEAKGSLITITPATFPLVTVILMGVLSLYYLISLYRGKSKNNRSAKKEEEFSSRVVFISVAALLIYTFLMHILGFILDTILLCTLMALYFRAKIWQIVTAGVVVPLAIYFLFRLMFVNLPSGFWS